MSQAPPPTPAPAAAWAPPPAAWPALLQQQLRPEAGRRLRLRPSQCPARPANRKPTHAHQSVAGREGSLGRRFTARPGGLQLRL